MSEPRASDIAATTADVAARIPGVARLDAGPLRTRATYGPHGRVDGVTVASREAVTEVVVHTAVRYGEPIPVLGERVAAEVTAALSAAFPGRRFLVACHVTDVAGPGDDGLPPALPPASTRRQLQ